MKMRNNLKILFEHCWTTYALFLALNQLLLLKSAVGVEILHNEISNLTKLMDELSTYNLKQQRNGFEPPDPGIDEAELNYINKRFKNIEGIIGELKQRYKNGTVVFDRIRDLEIELETLKRGQDNWMKENGEYVKRLKDTLSSTISILNNMTERLIEVESIAQEPKRLEELKRFLDARDFDNSMRYLNTIQDYYKIMDIIKDIFTKRGNRFADAEFLFRLSDYADSLNLRSLILKHVYDTGLFKSNEISGTAAATKSPAVTNMCYKLKLFDKLIRKPADSASSLAETNHISSQLKDQMKTDMPSDGFVNNFRRHFRKYSSPNFKNYQDSSEFIDTVLRMTGNEDGRKLEEITLSLRNDINSGIGTDCWFDISFRLMDRSSLIPLIDFDGIAAGLPPMVHITGNDMRENVMDETMTPTGKSLFKALERRDYNAALDPYRSIKNDVNQLSIVFMSLSYSVISQLDLDVVFDFIDYTDNDFNSRGTLYLAVLNAMPSFDSVNILCDLIRLLNRVLDHNDLVRQVTDKIKTSMQDDTSLLGGNYTVESVEYNQFVVKYKPTNSILAKYDAYPLKYGSRSYCYLHKSVNYDRCFELCSFPFFQRDLKEPLSYFNRPS